MEKTVRTNRKAGQMSLAAKIEYILVGLCVFAVLMFIVSNYVELSQLSTENSRLKDELAQLVDMEKTLNAKQEQIFNLEEIENKAKNDLGMIKMDKSQICYIELQSPDKLSTASEGEEVPQIVQNAIRGLNIVVEYLN
ncbi:MAG: septum formation initiator family protein [Clostridia bacterium]|nr:septum formation initiator family protein [Clostridia bacterium]